MQALPTRPPPHAPLIAYITTSIFSRRIWGRCPVRGGAGWRPQFLPYLLLRQNRLQHTASNCQRLIGYEKTGAGVVTRVNVADLESFRHSDSIAEYAPQDARNWANQPCICVTVYLNIRYGFSRFAMVSNLLQPDYDAIAGCAQHTARVTFRHA